MLSEESVSRIDLLCSVASLNDAALTLSDLRSLLRAESTVAELEEAFAVSPSLRERYHLAAGYIFERGRPPTVGVELEKRRRALKNLMMAVEISRHLVRVGPEVLAVSGSTAYESAKDSDDLDFFCVTGKDSAWIFLTKALLLLRAYRITSPRYRRACLSCVMDADYAGQAFSREEDALFARDALTAMVLKGNEEYGRLLGRADWMRGYFPQLYDMRSGPYRTTWAESNSTLRRLGNRFLYHTVGRYIRMKSDIQNRKIAGSGNLAGLFETRMAEDHCIYESTRYRKMREVYSRIPR